MKKLEMNHEVSEKMYLEDTGILYYVEVGGYVLHIDHFWVG